MLFGWFKRRRIERLTALGAVVTVDALTRGEAPRPRRLVKTEVGYGVEIWAAYGEITDFIKKGRMVRDGKLVIDTSDAVRLAAELQIPLETISVDF